MDKKISPTRICKLIIHDHNLVKKNKTDEAEKTNYKQEPNYPAESDIFNILGFTPGIINSDNIRTKTTTKIKAIANNDAHLNDGILLSSGGLHEKKNS